MGPLPTPAVPVIDGLDDALGVLFLASPSAVFVYDAESSEIVRANHAMTAASGWTPEELVTMTVNDLMTAPFDQARVRGASDRDVIALGHGEHRRRDGNTGCADFTAQVIDVGPRRYAVVVAIEAEHPVSELVDVHEQIRSNLAGRLHDGPIQTLTAASLRIGLLRRTATGDSLAEVESLITSAIGSLRGEMNELRSAADVASTLGEAVAGHLARIGLHHQLHIEIDGDVSTDEPLAAVAYRAVQLATEAHRRTGRIDGPVRTVRITVDGRNARVTVPVVAPDDVGSAAVVWAGMPGGVVEAGRDQTGATVTFGGVLSA